MRDMYRKMHLANIVGKYVNGNMNRRDFLKNAGMLGLGAGCLGTMGTMSRKFIPQAHAGSHGIEWRGDMMDWLKDVSSPFRGQTVSLATESTPPSNAINTTLKPFFEEVTGIKVNIEVLPLEQVLQKLTLDVASGLGTYDTYYLDQSWMAAFRGDAEDPRELYAANPTLAMPNYNFDDFLGPLVDGISMYDGTMVGVPYDIPVFIMMYRDDVYKELGLSVPTTFDQYMSNAQVIQAAKLGHLNPDGRPIYGTNGQMKSGHYSLECDWTMFAWAFGGSITNPDGSFAGNDANGLAGMDYWTKLKEYMPSGVTSWTWDGQGQDILQGGSAQTISWGEFFPWWDSDESNVQGKMMAAACPAPARPLRSTSDCGYGEIPGVAHQGGSSLAVSKYSKNKDAAWLFAQWATSYETQVYITALGGGTGPTRSAVYDDERVKANNRSGNGTTRHLDVVRDAIFNDMGSEPDLPEWADMSSNMIPIELGRYFAGEYGSAKDCLDTIAKNFNKTVGV